MLQLVVEIVAVLVNLQRGELVKPLEVKLQSDRAALPDDRLAAAGLAIL